MNSSSTRDTQIRETSRERKRKEEKRGYNSTQRTEVYMKGKKIKKRGYN